MDFGDVSFTDADLAQALDAMRRGESLESLAVKRLAVFTPSPSNNVHHRRVRDEQLRLIQDHLAATRIPLRKAV